MLLLGAVLGAALALGGGEGAAPDVPAVLERVLREPLALGNVSLQCKGHGGDFLQELANGTEWAVRMHDASGKTPAGLMRGSGDIMGDYDECLAVRGPGASFSGQYCTALLSAGLEGRAAAARYRVGLCVPSSCSASDVEAHLRRLLVARGPRGGLAVQVRPDDCHTARSDSRPYRPQDYAFLALVAIIAALVIVGTGYDIYLKKTDPKDTEGASAWQTALLAFSARRNAPPLLSTASPSGSLACVNGVRFLSMAWVVVFHAHAAVHRTPRANADETSRFKERWYMMILVNGTLSTDSFFLIGGVLLAYIFMRDRKKNQPFNLLTFYLHRYIRLTPVYAVVIFFYATILYRLGSGPMWDEFIKDERRKCVDWWFNNLLYVNNYNSNNNTCIVQSWYLATDMQFYWLSPLVLYPLWRWPKAGCLIIVTGMVASTAALVTLTAAYSGIDFSSWYDDNWNLTYTPVYTRAVPYLLGLALGYLLQVLRKDFALSKAAAAVGWATALALIGAALFGGYRLRQSAYGYQAAEVVCYDALHRAAWAAGLAWLVFACVQGRGGPVNSLLSCGLMQPLSRLSYCVYLSHFAIIYVRLGLVRTPAHIGVGDVLLEGLLMLVVSLALSVVLTLAFEVPFMLIDKNILTKRIAAATSRLPADLKRSLSLQRRDPGLPSCAGSSVCIVDSSPAS
ncbi:nose resistant to fluoxetine protein 6-like [Bacillus rossius redtenbacheri]|uniref:nose resistant to fluoxetine protein 6-like n=1 Tax=Bacillus rossius redtenbacheri TaxID=93214 RepID=UPI002FDDD830